MNSMVIIVSQWAVIALLLVYGFAWEALARQWRRTYFKASKHIQSQHEIIMNQYQTLLDLERRLRRTDKKGGH